MKKLVYLCVLVSLSNFALVGCGGAGGGSTSTPATTEAEATETSNDAVEMAGGSQDNP